MKGGKSIKYVYLLALLVSFTLVHAGTGNSGNGPYKNRPLDLVFCVDLSGSTNGLINDLRDNLWLIINLAEHMEPKPDLRIGVVGFSRPSFGKENAYVRILSPLTRNFDAVVAELYKLKPSIEKGDQIVSAALQTCINNMKWTDHEDGVKMIYLIGNGMVTANGYEYVRYCEQARSKNIPIHALYVMKSANWFKEIPGYRRIAGLTNGMQTEITINKSDEVVVWTSVNKDLLPLNQKFNATFLWSGVDSAACRRSIVASDSGAYFATKDAFLNRMYFKSKEDFSLNFANCDIVSDNALVYDDIGPEVSREFLQRIKELLGIREQLRLEIRSCFSEEEIAKIEKAYLAGELRDNNILHRSVMNILYRYWGMH